MTNANDDGMGIVSVIRTTDLARAFPLPLWSPDEPPVYCDRPGCGVRCTPDNWHHLRILIVGDGGGGLPGRGRLTGRGRRFCSTFCRRAYWLSEVPDPLFAGKQVRNPDEIVPPPPGVVPADPENWEEVTCRCAADPACPLCAGLGRRWETSAFLFAHPDVAGWKPEWAGRSDLEHDLAVYVFEFEHDQRHWTFSPDETRAFRNVDHLVEAWSFPTPVQLVEWWQAALSVAEHDKIRADYAAYLQAQRAGALTA